MKITVIGAGAIGGLVAGYLKLNGSDVTLAARKESVGRINQEGLIISGVKGKLNIKIEAHEKLIYQPDLVILTTKTQDIESAIKDNFDFIKNSLIMTTQNGVETDNIVADYIPEDNIISSIVMFGATCLYSGKIVHNFEGSWIIGKLGTKADKDIDDIKKTINDAFNVVISDDIKAMKYLKIFVNANNCIAAILGISMQEAFRNIDISAIAISIWKEGLNIVETANVKLVSLPDFPVERVTKLTSIPLRNAAKTYSQIMSNLSKEPLYGSILQSIKRNRKSEINYINGEFVRLAKANNLSAGLNDKLIAMVYEVEDTKRFFTKKELIKETKEFINN
ncbi:MAG TPA: ketopantoate reductase family protein [Candidatus Omnitrophica bacterium]|nr:ketopantoate reductase family protein [Candidatus Omnitrophota bacterium]